MPAKNAPFIADQSVVFAERQLTQLTVGKTSNNNLARVRSASSDVQQTLQIIRGILQNSRVDERHISFRSYRSLFANDPTKHKHKQCIIFA